MNNTEPYRELICSGERKSISKISEGETDIVKWPDPRLNKICKSVPLITDRDKIEVIGLASKLWEIAIKNKDRCLGLASPQIGSNLRLFIMNSKDGPLTFINPRIIKSSGYITSMEECLSIPYYSRNVKRRACVTLEYTNTDFQVVTKSFTGREAICVQHEMDHLIGKLIDAYPC